MQGLPGQGEQKSLARRGPDCLKRFVTLRIYALKKGSNGNPCNFSDAKMVLFVARAKEFYIRLRSIKANNHRNRFLDGDVDKKFFTHGFEGISAVWVAAYSLGINMDLKPFAIKWMGRPESAGDVNGGAPKKNVMGKQKSKAGAKAVGKKRAEA